MHPRPSFAIGLVSCVFREIPWGILYSRLLEHKNFVALGFHLESCSVKVCLNWCQKVNWTFWYQILIWVDRGWLWKKLPPKARSAWMPVQTISSLYRVHPTWHAHCHNIYVGLQHYPPHIHIQPSFNYLAASNNVANETTIADAQQFIDCHFVSDFHFQTSRCPQLGKWRKCLQSNPAWVCKLQAQLQPSCAVLLLC